MTQKSYPSEAAEPVDGGEQAREAASMRWKAVEAFNCAPGLSPAERRVGIALICSMDSRSRACFPSETRLAALCDLHPSAIKKAKAKLRKRGLIDWHNPDGPRHRSYYGFNWNALELLAFEAKKRADKAVAERSYFPTRSVQSTRAGTLETVRSTQTDTNKGTSTDSQSTQIAFQGTQLARQGAHLDPPKVPIRVPELSHYPPTITAEIHHAVSQAKAALSDADDDVGGSFSRSAQSGQAETPEALEMDQPQQTKAALHFPKLFAAFSDDPPVLERLSHSTFDNQQRAAKALAMKGLDRARAIIMR